MKLALFACVFVVFGASFLIVPSNGQCPAPGDCDKICGSRDHIYHCNPPSCNCRCGRLPNPFLCRAAPPDCAAFCGGRYPYSAICSGFLFSQCSCFC